jgi:predicted flap endonuclease-1-like 5' DNA nuclease
VTAAESNAPEEALGATQPSDVESRIERIERQVASLVAASEDAEVVTMRPENADEPPIEGVSGLGETYRSRLKEEGIGTLPALAGSDPATVADAAGVTEKRLASGSTGQTNSSPPDRATAPPATPRKRSISM